MVRSRGTPEYIAGGVALGLTIGLIIPIGFQIVIAVPLAFLLRVVKVPAVIFTFVTNHFTVIFIYPFQCWIGSYLIFKPLSLDSFSSRFSSLAEAATWTEKFRALGTLGLDVMIPFFAGGIFLALICAPAGYVISRRLVLAYLKKKEQIRLKRQQKAAARKTPQTGS